MRIIGTGLAAAVAMVAAHAAVQAAVIGKIVPAEPITAARIETLPEGERAAWTAYLKRSDARAQADQAALDAELKSATPSAPAPTGSPDSMPLDRDAAWYAGPEARHIADVVVSFQTPAGGWNKNQDRTGPVRAPGQALGGSARSSTMDNGATTSELKFLALVASATPGAAGEAYRRSFLRGIDYLLSAQFPNGGWPQYWPLAGGYHDAMTFNDDAMISVVEFLRQVSLGQAPYTFTPEPARRRAADSVARALDVILKAQVVVNGRKTVWAQQHDALTLQPVGARSYEPAALSGSESASILLYLMRLPNPSPAIVDAVHAGVAWLRGVSIADHAWTDGGDPVKGRLLVPKPGAPLLWARYYSLDGKPRFGDRDRSLHDSVDSVGVGRRNGYAWFHSNPAKTIAAYAEWSKAHPQR